MNSDMTFRVPTWDEINDLAGRLKRSDVEELDAAYGLSPVEAFDAMAANGITVNGVFIDGRLEFVYGVNDRDYSDMMASVWMVSSEAITRHVKTMLKFGNRWLDEQQAKHGCLFNFVDARAQKTLSWLKRMKFSLYAVPSYGVRGLPFYLVVRGKCDVLQ